MKYAVVGLGAVGSIVSGSFTKINEDVILIGKKPQVEAINKNCLMIDDISIDECFRATEDVSAVEDADVVLICVKSQDTKKVATQIKPFLKSNTVIISLQNGIQNADVLQDITGKPSLSSVVLFNAVYNEAGNVSRTMKGGILLEYRKEYDELLQMIRASFNKAGIPVKFIEDIHDASWSKLVLNLQIAVTALTGQTIQESLKNRISRQIIIATLKEGIQITNQAGITLCKLPGIDPKRVIRMLSIFGSFSAVFSHMFLGLQKNARNSMWQSLSNKKPTEINYINGEIVKLAKTHKIEAPINTKLVALVKAAEKSHNTSYLEPEKLQKKLDL